MKLSQRTRHIIQQDDLYVVEEIYVQISRYWPYHSLKNPGSIASDPVYPYISLF